MAFSSGLELANNTLAFAEHQNVELMGARGNQVVSGVGVTPQGTPDLTVAVAAGTVLAGGVVVAVSAEATFAGTPNTFATTQGNLTSGQAEFVFIHIDSSGVITNTEGGAAAAGQQLPPDVPEDEVIIAMITLTEGDTTIDSVDIEDWGINVPKGGYFAGDIKSTDSDLTFLFGRSRLASPDADVAFFSHRDMSTNANYALSQTSDGITQLNAATTKTLILSINDVAQFNITTAGMKNPVDNAGFFTGASNQLRMFHTGSEARLDSVNDHFILLAPAAKNIALRLGGVVEMQDVEDSSVNLFALDTSARTLTIGSTADPIALTVSPDVDGTHIIGRLRIHTPFADNIVISHFDLSGTTDFALLQNNTGTTALNAASGNTILFRIANSTVMEMDASSLKNPIDNGGFHTGASDDLRMYHDGSSSNIVNITGLLRLRNASGNIDMLTGGSFLISDDDDTDVIIFNFNTTARTLVIGATDGNDDIATSMFGTLFVSDGIGLDAAILTFATGATGRATFAGDVQIGGSIFSEEAGPRLALNTPLRLTTSTDTSYAFAIGTSGAEAQVTDEAIAEAWNLWSSIRWKENFREIENPLSIINKLNPLIYDLKEASEPKHYNKIGFVAEELGKILPGLVNWEDKPSSNGIIYATGIDYARLTALNMAAIKELYKEVMLIKEKL